MPEPKREEQPLPVYDPSQYYTQWTRPQPDPEPEQLPESYSLVEDPNED